MNTERRLYQWDTGQKLVGCTGLYVDFPIDNEVYRVETTDGMCIIPDELLQTSGGHKVYECMTNNTIRSFAFSVTPRPKPPDYVYTPTERLTFEGLVQKVDDAVADMIRRAESGEFDGHTPVKGTDYFTASEIQQIQNEVSSGAIGEFKSVVDTETETFNANAETKFTAYNQNASEKTASYNANATEKLNAYNTNANNKVAEFDAHTEQIQTDVSELKSDLSDIAMNKSEEKFSNIGTWVINNVVSINGTIVSFDGYSACETYIPIPKWVDRVSVSYSGINCLIGAYDSEKVFIKRVSVSSSEKTQNFVPQDVSYIRISVNSLDLNTYGNCIIRYHYELDDSLRVMKSDISYFVKYENLLYYAKEGRNGDILFTSNDVSVGDEVYYSFKKPIGHAGFINLYDSNNNRLSWHGDGTGSSSTETIEGHFTIPSNFYVCKVGSAATLVFNYIRYNNDIDKLKEEIDAVDQKIETEENYIRERTNNTHRTKTPMITFIDDDGNPAFYTHILPLMRKYSFPYCSAYIYRSDNGDADHMSISQLREIVEAGGEILGHGNTDLLTLPIEQAESDVKNIRDIMLEKGFRLNGYCYPSGGTNEEIREMMTKYYDYAIYTAVSGHPINVGMLANYYIIRCNCGGYYDTVSGDYASYNSASIEYFKKVIDDCIENNGWIVFMSHIFPMTEGHKLPQWQDVDQLKLLDDIMAYIKQKIDSGANLKVVTASEGFNVHGNAVQYGDYLGYYNNSSLHTHKGCGISKDGMYDFPLENKYTSPI